MNRIHIKTSYYEQFGADETLEVPAEGYGGWKEAKLPLDLSKTAVVVMHAWDVGERNENPGVYDACEFIPRSYAICENVLPPLLAAVRKTDVPLYHVVAGSYYQEMEGYQATKALAGEEPPRSSVSSGEVAAELRKFRTNNVFPGQKNLHRMEKPYTFAKQALPLPGEGIAENAAQLLALCKRDGIDHLIYAGFAINMCLLISPAGMVDMSRRGLLCSAFRDAVTAGENKESARNENAKELALWYLSVMFGFVYNTKDFIKALPEAL